MNKIFCITLSCMFIFLSACSKTSEGETEEKLSEEFTYEQTSELIDNSGQKYYNVNSWVRITELDFYNTQNNLIEAYYPNQYFESGVDSLLDSFDNKPVIINVPNGTKKKEEYASHGVLFAKNGKLPIIQNDEIVDYYNNNSDFAIMSGILYGVNGESTSFELNPDNYKTKITNHTRCRCDVLPFSAALYEDFFECDMSFQLDIYGVSKEYFNDKLGTYTYSSTQYEEYCKGIEEDYKSFDHLSSYNLDESGVYYIDFTQYNDAYEDYYIVAKDTSEENFTYFIYGSGGYIVEDENAYQKWKEDNKDKFIN
ncbi:hypothetical protein [Lachnospira multipara]|uniref:Lipoprotein n=1 Tax=Lachnospira multipara TaxID=28051 RepID=A0A1H5UT37_9FIRM|nr:hypothetical protein [Lachnospira multipara]SEF78140.1 hypothetical protein SAMN05216537_10889 [Lachnospira multipara]